MEHFFGPHSGHLNAQANRIAKKHGAWHCNYTEPNGEKRGWFACRNRGSPFNERIAKLVLQDINARGGIESFTRKR